MPEMRNRRAGRLDTWIEDVPRQDQVEPRQCLATASTGIETEGSTSQAQRVAASRRINPAVFLSLPLT